MIGEFFIAFFGSLFYAGKYSGDKAAKANYTHEYNSVYGRRDAYIESLQNKKIEEEVTEYIINDYDKALAEYRSLIKDLDIDELYLWTFDATDSRYKRIENSGMKRMLLASRGVVRSTDARYGIRLVTRWNDTKAADIAFRTFWKLLRRMDELLRAKGVAPMVVIGGGLINYSSKIISTVSLYDPSPSIYGLATWRRCIPTLK